MVMRKYRKIYLIIAVFPSSQYSKVIPQWQAESDFNRIQNWVREFEEEKDREEH